MSSTVFNAYQKFYSALSNLKRFCSDNDFYDNVSALDSFFSEFRSVTFILQSSIGNNIQKKHIYEEKRDMYLKECKWFNVERVNSVHKSPFSLVKQIRIREFSPNGGVILCDNTYTIENDERIETLIHDITSSFKNLDYSEVFFSASFSFYEKNSPDLIYDKLLQGINVMNDFLNSITEAYDEPCDMCDDIRKKIQRVIAEISFVDGRLNSDYVFYPHRNEFERGGIIQMLASKKLERNVDTFFDSLHLNSGADRFEKFVLLHVVMGNTDLMPTSWVINRKSFFYVDLFNSDIKTTFYRKIADIAERILTEDIEEVFFMFTYAVFNCEDFIDEITSRQRVAKSKTDLLVFYRITENVAEEYIFEEEILTDVKKIADNIKHGRTSLDMGRVNMKPIVDAFALKLHNEVK